MKLLIILVILLIRVNASAAPVITGYGGSLADGEDFYLNGTGFGTHSLNHEWVGANIEAGADGNVFSKTGWTTGYYAADPQYEKDEYHSGSQSLKFTFTTTGSEVGCAAEYQFSAKINNLYFTTWIKLHKDDAQTTYQWKNWRIKDVEGHSFNYAVIGDNWANADGWIEDVAVQAWGCNPDTGKENRGGLIYTDSFLFDTWQRIECWYTNDQVEWRRIGRATNEIIVCLPTDGWHGACDTSLNCPVDKWEWLRIGHYYSNLPAGGGDMKVYYDDIYIDTTRARVEIGDNAIWASCTQREIQIPTAWDASGTSISATFNWGSFGTGVSVYAFVVDSSGVASGGYEILTGATPGATTPTASITDSGSPTETGVTGTYTISLDSGGSVWVNWQTQGTGTWGTDVENVGSGMTVSYAISGTTILTPKQDTSVEGNETFGLNLIAGVTAQSYNISLTDSGATLTMLDDDSVPNVTVYVVDSTATEENQTTGQFQISCDSCYNLPVEFAYSGTAIAADISSTTSSPITLAADETPYNIFITPVDDSEDEGDETYIITLTDTANYDSDSGTSVGTITISDNDASLATPISTDNFTDGSVAAFWTWDAGTGGTNAETGSYLQMGSSSGGAWTSWDSAFLYLSSVTSSFDVWTKVTHNTLWSEYQKAGLVFKLSGNTFVQINQVYEEGVTRYQVGHTINGSPDANRLITGDNRVSYLRISRASGVFHTYYATSDPLVGGWTLFDPTSGTTIISEEGGDLGIMAATSGGDNFMAEYDWFDNWPTTLFAVIPGKLDFTGPGAMSLGPKEMGKFE